MFVKRKFRLLLTFVVLLLLVSLILLRLINSETVVDQKNRSFFEKYGWTVDSLGSVHELPKMELDEERIQVKKKIEVSEKLGLRPNDYYGKPVTEYFYKLSKMGNKNNLFGGVIVYKGKVIYAYITHGEDNLRLEFWSLDTPYTQIVNEIQDLYNRDESLE